MYSLNTCDRNRAPFFDSFRSRARRCNQTAITVLSVRAEGKQTKEEIRSKARLENKLQWQKRAYCMKRNTLEQKRVGLKPHPAGKRPASQQHLAWQMGTGGVSCQ